MHVWSASLTRLQQIHVFIKAQLPFMLPGQLGIPLHISRARWRPSNKQAHLLSRQSSRARAFAARHCHLAYSLQCSCLQFGRVFCLVPARRASHFGGRDQFPHTAMAAPPAAADKLTAEEVDEAVLSTQEAAAIKLAQATNARMQVSEGFVTRQRSTPHGLPVDFRSNLPRRCGAAQ